MEGAKWIHVFQNRETTTAVLTTVIKFRLPWTAEIFWLTELLLASREGII
jgi:hypothetical protein